MVKEQKCYVVKYYDNTFSENRTSWKMDKSEANRMVSRMKKTNKISINNSKIISGKPFEMYKRIKLKKVGC